MKKYLTDKEILNWNDRLVNVPYVVTPRYHTQSSYPAIMFKQIVSNHNYTEVVTVDPSLEFQFSFSVAKNRMENFFHIFNNWFSRKIETQTLYEDKDNNQKFSEIELSDKIISKKEEKDHFVKEKEYTKLTYHFKGRLSSIIAYVMFLEDSIEIFSNIYGYDESGGEHILTKFSIGDIVSKTEDKSEDFIVVDYFPIKTNDRFYLDYEISKIMIKGQIIQYSSSEIINESKISFSRNNRIDNILN